MSYEPLLGAYPFPAFAVPLSARSTHGGPSPSPVFANQALCALLLGGEAHSSEFKGAWLDALHTLDQARAFTDWAFAAAAADQTPVTTTLQVELRLRWTDVRPKLELVQTVLDGHILITSIPHSALPQPPTSPPVSRSARPSLPVLPSSLLFTSTPSCRELYESYDWASTPLGPRESWTDTFQAAVNYALANPFPTCVWWGKELVLLYNDEYAAIAGSKHPSIFGKAGSVAWGELWEMIGPVSARVLQGECVFRVEDLLFFNRLTEEKLPEETYHNWNYVPVQGADGVVNGFINSTFDTTGKVVADRRLALLRELTMRAGLARTQDEFVRALLDVLQGSVMEAPFAAVWRCIPLDAPPTPSSASSPPAAFPNALPSKIRLELQGTVGVPSDGTHHAFPASLDLSLASPPSRASSRPGAAGRPSSFGGALERTSSLRESRERLGTPERPSSFAGTPNVFTSLPTVPAQDERAPGTFRDAGHTTGSASSGVSARALSRSPPTSAFGGASSPSEELHLSSHAEESRGAAFWPFADACVHPMVTRHIPRLPSWVTARAEPRAWGEVPREAVVIPLSSSSSLALDDTETEGDMSADEGGKEEESVARAVLVLGLNSRRPYDASYSAFIDLLRLSLNALLTAVSGREADGARARQLAQLDEAKTAFFSNASHEFRTPLTLIQGPLEDCLTMLKVEKEREKVQERGRTGDGEVEKDKVLVRVKDRERAVRERVSMALRNVARLKRLVDCLMDFSKLAANRLEGRFRPVVLGPHTADLASLFRSVIERSGIEYDVRCENAGDVGVYVDPDFWEKIVFNLIGNAFKYTMAGKISVCMEVRDGCMHFRVSDTGVGIPPSDIDKVFDRFHRVNTVGRSHEGTGIGLALTKELVILHGGRLTLTSLTADDAPDNHGSSFTVSIPLGSAHLPATHVDATPLAIEPDEGAHRMYGRGIVDEAGRWASTSTPPLHLSAATTASGSETGESGSSSDSGRMDPSTLFFVKSDRILLVDDNADMRRYIAALLRPYCTVLEAINGQDALDVLDRLRAEEDALDSTQGVVRPAHKRMPDLIISDVMMPVLDGLGLIARLRTRTDTRLLPIILVTAKESEEARVEGLLGGADDYLCKPFTARELVARVHLQMQLGKRRAELEALFGVRTREIRVLSDLSPVGILRADADGRTTYTNLRWREISGSIEEQQDWLALVEEGMEEALSAWGVALEGRRRVNAGFRFRNGRYAKGQFEPVISEQGSFIGIIATLTDLSETRRFEQVRLAHAEERAMTARKQAEEADRARAEADERRRGQELLIDVTSHELRQPVSAILNCSSLVRSNLGALYTELARGTPYTPSESMLKLVRDDLEALDAIYQCGLAQERIANDVLSLSRIQLEVLSISPVDFDLVAEMRRIVAIFSNEVKMKGIALEARLDPSVQYLGVQNVRSDRARFGQIVTNLLSNAIKFTDTSVGKRDITATLHASRRAPPHGEPCVPPPGPELPFSPTELPADVYLYCAVRDSGPGLQPDDLALLFQRFQQGSNSHNVFGGSGLGLFVSRKLCELMDGNIDVDSVYGEGATFRFYVKAQAIPGEPISPVSTPSASASPSTSPSAGAPVHVLIAEDNLINQTVLNRQLTAQGFVTTLANNGQQALDSVRARAAGDHGPQRRFDAVLMDCEMPVMDGLSAVREIRRLEATGELPQRSLVFALTGNAREGQIQLALDAGMDDVIIKPYRLEQLVTVITESVAHNRKQQQRQQQPPLEIAPEAPLPVAPEAPT